MFEKLHESGGNSGLGLAICQRIIERHNTAISVADNPGGGTRIHFTLPITATPAADSRVEATHTQSVSA